MKGSTFTRIFLVSLVLILIALCGGVFVVHGNSDKILEEISAKIEKSSGYPLRLESMPAIGLFPPRVEIGKTEWGDKEGGVYVRFSRARAGVVLSSLFSGSPEVSKVEFDDLYVFFRQPDKKPAPSADAGSDPENARAAAPGDTGSFPDGTAQAAENPAPSSSSGADTQTKVMDMLREKMPGAIILRNATLHFVSRKGQAVELTELNTEIHSKDGLSTASPLHCRLLESKVSGKAAVDLSGGVPIVTADISAPGLNLGQLAQAVAGQDLAEGTGNLAATVTFSALDVLPTFSGEGRLDSPVLTLKASALPSNLSAIQGLPEQGRLENAVFIWTADMGRLHLSRGDVDGPGFTLKTTGNVDLPGQRLDLEGTLDIPGVATLPVTLKGPFQKPRYIVDSAGAVDAVRQTLNKHGVDLDEAINKGLERLMRNRK